MLHIKSFVFSPIEENTYVLYNDEKDCIIIDPGCYFDDEKETLKNFIEENNLNPKLLLNTHCHLDHVFGNKFAAETWKLTLHIHEKEKQLLEFAPASGLLYNMPFDNYAGELAFLKEGTTITFGEDELQILFTPGHSPGSVSFYCAKQNFVISGDVLFQQSVGRTDLPGGDHQTLINSICTQLFVLPDETKVYSGHGDVTTIKEEKKYNPYLQ
ncbi:MBL fold metallo-hydrolase [Ferruginibacter albus]|uniref:MBL fold metallo-hydrolase n=1 Tax=Ferruginibacter albus TaxID=2875540 RepID=UPI001CC4FE42|nr:MBL fold metallo-hydrolase [Ferruginibacter albus]UAY51672.1 MBL fold metallo-hydrolase [Ferruginibacter albus]